LSERGRPNPLRSSRSFRRLWLARTISHVGDGIALVALVLLVQESEGTGTAVGVLLLASSLPRFLGPLAGVVADRVEQRTLMVLCDVGNAAIFATISWSRPSFGVLLALVAASAVLDTLFAPAGRSAVPALVDGDDLLRANAWMGTSLNLQVALGTLLGGTLVGDRVRGAWRSTRCRSPYRRSCSSASRPCVPRRPEPQQASSPSGGKVCHSRGGHASSADS
jgi:MFS family permease